jgi:O-antigen ligase
LSAFALAVLLFVRKKKLNIPPWLLLIVALYLYLIVPCLVLPLVEWGQIFGVSTVLIGTVSIGLVLTNKLISLRVAAYVMLCAAITNVVAIFLGFDTTPLEFGGFNESRVSGLLGNANSLMLNLALSAMVIGLISRIPLQVRLVSLFVAFYGITVSGSRKGVILGVALFLFVVKRMSNKLSRLKQVAILGSLLLMAAVSYQYLETTLVMLSDNVLAVNRFIKIFSGGEASFSERKWLIEAGYRIWLESPFFGEGFGQFSFISGFGAYSHNNYIELLVSGGLIALILYYTLYILIIYYAFKCHRNDLFYAVLIIVTLLMIDTAMVSFVARSNMLFLVFVLAYFNRNTERREAVLSSKTTLGHSA